MESKETADSELLDIAHYIAADADFNKAAYENSRLALFDFLGCGLKALDEKSCRQAIEPIVPEARVVGGARVPGTQYEFDPATAAFAIGTMGRWLDFNDSWFGKGGGHPSDMWGALLAVGDYQCRRNDPILMPEILENGIKAYEVMGLHLIDNEFGPFDYTAPLKVAVSASVCQILGGGEDEIIGAISNCWADGQPLRIYRHPYTTWRKNWASPDAAARGIWHAYRAIAGETGYPAVLSTPGAGVLDAEQKGKPFQYPMSYGSHVMENILFKIFPAQFRAQTAAEAVLKIRPSVHTAIDEIERIQVFTTERAMRTVDKQGPLRTAAARDHSLQYIIAVMLLHGRLDYDLYNDDIAADPRIDLLRAKIVLTEREKYTKGFEDPGIRTDATSIKVFFTNGESTSEVEILYPLGDPRRRQEAGPLLAQKFLTNIKGRLVHDSEIDLIRLFENQQCLEGMSVSEFMDLWVPN